LLFQNRKSQDNGISWYCCCQYTVHYAPGQCELSLQNIFYLFSPISNILAYFSTKRRLFYDLCISESFKIQS
jgi:hypothetical protein